MPVCRTVGGEPYGQPGSCKAGRGDVYKRQHLLSVRNVTVMAMFGALAAVLMIFEVPLPFIAPSFYGLDISLSLIHI